MTGPDDEQSGYHTICPFFDLDDPINKLLWLKWFNHAAAALLWFWKQTNSGYLSKTEMVFKKKKLVKTCRQYLDTHLFSKKKRKRPLAAFISPLLQYKKLKLADGIFQCGPFLLSEARQGGGVDSFCCFVYLGKHTEGPENNRFLRLLVEEAILLSLNADSVIKELHPGLITTQEMTTSSPGKNSWKVGGWFFFVCCSRRNVLYSRTSVAREKKYSSAWIAAAVNQLVSRGDLCASPSYLPKSLCCLYFEATFILCREKPFVHGLFIKAINISLHQNKNELIDDIPIFAEKAAAAGGHINDGGVV